MAEIEDEQSWGLGIFPDAHFKAVGVSPTRALSCGRWA